MRGEKYRNAPAIDTAKAATRVSAARRDGSENPIQNSPIAIRQAKKAIDVATQVDLGTGYAFEIEAYNRMVPTRDRLEGVLAFNEKRAPRFEGR